MGGLGGCTGSHHDSESGHGNGRGVVGPGWTGVPGGCATFLTLCPLPCHFPPRQYKPSGAGSVSHFLLLAPAVSGHVRPAPCARPCPCPHCAPQQPPGCPMLSQPAAPHANCVLVTLSPCQVRTGPCLALPLPQAQPRGGSRAGQTQGMSLVSLGLGGCYHLHCDSVPAGYLLFRDFAFNQAEEAKPLMEFYEEVRQGDPGDRPCVHQESGWYLQGPWTQCQEHHPK